MTTLRERLMARAHEFASGRYTKADRAELILEGARMAYNEALREFGGHSYGPYKHPAITIQKLLDGLG